MGTSNQLEGIGQVRPDLVWPKLSLPSDQVQQLSPIALAYVGDAVYELYMRVYFLLPPKRIQDYHQQVVAQVRAERQALQLRSLQPHLNSLELDILRRGRNAATNKPKRLDAATYQQATSLETLIGYLYLSDPARLVYLLSQLSLSPGEPGRQQQPKPDPRPDQSFKPVDE